MIMRRTDNNLLKSLQQADFALWETSLFLDSHPDNKQALMYYKKMLAKREEIKSRYTASCGPITHNDVTGDRWSWVDGPWPWQNEV